MTLLMNTTKNITDCNLFYNKNLRCKSQRSISCLKRKKLNKNKLMSKSTAL